MAFQKTNAAANVGASTSYNSGHLFEQEFGTGRLGKSGRPTSQEGSAKSRRRT